ncbi:MAG: hypothetical protein HUU35_16965, partial [Armatimonadetes bacterium]|nr:hypothetical protein [Armatimonadota bacterium]
MPNHRGLLMLSLVTAAQAAGPYRFGIQSPRAARDELVRVALPLPAGEVTGDPAGSVVVGDE